MKKIKQDPLLYLLVSIRFPMSTNRNVFNTKRSTLKQHFKHCRKELKAPKTL